MKCCRSRPARPPTGSRPSPTAYAISSAGSCSFPGPQGEDDRRRIDGLRLLQQVPAIVSLSLVDPTGTERVFVSRVSMNRTGRGADMSADPAVVGARANRVWYGPVRLSARFRAVHADRGRGKPRGRRHRRCRHQPETDLGCHRGDQDRRHRPRPCRRRRRASDRASRHQPRAAQRGRRRATSSRLKAVVSAANGSAVATTARTASRSLRSRCARRNVGWTVIAEQPIAGGVRIDPRALWRSLMLIGHRNHLRARARLLAGMPHVGADPQARGRRLNGSGWDSSTIASRSKAATNWSNWPSASTRWRKSSGHRSRNPSASTA